MIWGLGNSKDFYYTLRRPQPLLKPHCCEALAPSDVDVRFFNTAYCIWSVIQSYKTSPISISLVSFQRTVANETLKTR